MSITLDDIKVALAIIENGEGSEITLRSGDIELIVRRGPPGMAAPQGAAAWAPPSPSAAVALSTAPAASLETPAHASGDRQAPPSPTAIPLRAPLTGMIYRAPAPDEPPFVEPGSTVADESVVCIIDVMKVMNLIKTPAAGRIVRINLADGQLVNKDDVILWVEPN